ncbi:MAG: GLPGLI family protein [Janthinobacterium lividum]
MRYRYFVGICLLPLASLAQTAPALPADQARVECLYRLTYQRDSTDAKTRTETLRLQIGSKLSRCENQATLYMDSVMTAALNESQVSHGDNEHITINLNGTPSSKFTSEYKAVVFKIPTAATVVVYDRIGTTKYYYQEPASLFTWVIAPTTATIAGYACQRATTTFGGRTWEAWFTRAVPIADGPYKFSGLPGLIVKVADTRGHFVFALTKLRQLVPPVAIAPPEAGAKLIAKAELARGKADYDRTVLTQLLASGNIRFTSPEEAEKAKQRAQERAHRKPNPLELK